MQFLSWLDAIDVFANSMNPSTLFEGNRSAEFLHARRQGEARCFAMSEAVLTSQNYDFDDAQADLIETENHERLFFIGGTRHLCISGVT